MSAAGTGKVQTIIRWAFESGLQPDFTIRELVTVVFEDAAITKYRFDACRRAADQVGAPLGWTRSRVLRRINGRLRPEAGYIGPAAKAASGAYFQANIGTALRGS